MDSLTTIYKGLVPLPGGGTAVYNYSGVAWYRHADWLGSSRFGSTPTQTLYNDLAFAPFGEVYASTGSVDESFTGNNEDTSAALYDAQYREYGIQGRWPSPDPAGMTAANPANPQSWNRYAYVMNNPLALTDPTGFGSMGCLVAGMQRGVGAHPYCIDTPFGGGSGDDGGGGGGDDGSGIDGGFGPSSLTGDGYASTQCPDNACGGFAQNSSGGWQWVDFNSFVGGASGYFYSPDLTNGLNVVNGQVYSDANYNQLMLESFGDAITIQRIQLATAIANNSNGNLTFDQAYADLDQNGGRLQGGNWDFVPQNGLGPDDLDCGGDSRCNGIHFSGGYVHLDTSNPFSSPWGFIEHSVVDVFLGNTVFWVLPR